MGAVQVIVCLGKGEAVSIDEARDAAEGEIGDGGCEIDRTSPDGGGYLVYPLHLVKAKGDGPSRGVGNGGEYVILIIRILGRIEYTTDRLLFLGEVALGIVRKDVGARGIGPAGEPAYSIGHRGGVVAVRDVLGSIRGEAHRGKAVEGIGGEIDHRALCVHLMVPVHFHAFSLPHMWAFLMGAVFT